MAANNMEGELFPPLPEDLITRIIYKSDNNSTLFLARRFRNHAAAAIKINRALPLLRKIFTELNEWVDVTVNDMIPMETGNYFVGEDADAGGEEEVVNLPLGLLLQYGLNDSPMPNYIPLNSVAHPVSVASVLLVKMNAPHFHKELDEDGIYRLILSYERARDNNTPHVNLISQEEFQLFLSNLR